MHISRVENLVLRDIPNIRRQANTAGGGRHEINASDTRSYMRRTRVCVARCLHLTVEY